MISEFFIKRPVFATVISLIIVLLGVISREKLPILKNPKIQYPIITVESNYPGVSPDVVESNVTKILEDSFATIQGIDYMQSSSDAGQSNITLVFNSDVNIDAAANDVRDRIFRVQSNLPRDMRTPSVKKTSNDDSSIFTLVFKSDKYTVDEIRDYIERFAQNKLEVINGVARVDITGGGEFAMHIRLDPVKLAKYNLTPIEVNNAIHSQTMQTPGGVIQTPDKQFSVVVKGELLTAPQFNEIVITTYNGKLVRLKDVGYAEKSPKDRTSCFLYNGHEVVAVDIYKQSVANPIAVVNDIKKVMPMIKKYIPHSIDMEVARNDADYIEKSINRVYQTMFEAILLVIGVVLLFLWSIKSSFIPLVTIPVSILGTFALLYAFNCSINTITLLALVLAIGLVVDDAIVILENVYKYMEKGLDSVTAAIKGTNEITFAVIAMTLTLAAVYAPIAFSSGQIGKYFTEFSIALSGAVIISGFVALTLSPMMCAKILHGVDLHSEGKQKQNEYLKMIDEKYSWLIEHALKYKYFIILGGIIISLIGGLLAIYKIPSENFPKEDAGYVSFRAFGPTGASYNYMKENADLIEEKLQDLDTAYYRLLNITNRKIDVFIKLIDWDERQKSCFEVSDQIEKKLKNITGVNLQIGGGTGNSNSTENSNIVTFVLQTSDGLDKLREYAMRFSNFLYRDGRAEVAKVLSSQFDTAPEISVYINRDRAASLGINVMDIAEAIEILFRGRIPTKVKNQGKLYDVFIKLDESMRNSTSDISKVFVKSKDYYSTDEYGRRTNEEKMVSVSDLVTIKKTDAPVTLYKYNQMLSMDFSIVLRDKVSLTDGISKIEEIKDAHFGDGVQMSFTRDTKKFLEDKNQLYFIFGMSLLFIFLVLAAQFESFIDPFIILLSVPLAIAGALIVLAFIRDGSLNIYSKIGFITLIGLITKHGILIVDFANHLQEQGKSKIEAIKEAAKLRLRPILMTTFAMVIGVIPLAFSTGAGAESRIQIGWTILGGMLLGTIFTLFFVPVMYSILARTKHIAQK